MAKGGSTPTRVTADIATMAASVAQNENWTVAEQINDWARIGMEVERSTSAEGRRLRVVIAGDEQFSTLTEQDRTTAHATIDAAMATRVAGQRFGPGAHKAEHVSVSIDENGDLIEIAPDGTRRLLSPDRLPTKTVATDLE